MDLFLTKLESVSKQFIGDTHFPREVSLLKRPILFSWLLCFFDIVGFPMVGVLDSRLSSVGSSTGCVHSVDVFLCKALSS